MVYTKIFLHHFYGCLVTDLFVQVYRLSSDRRFIVCEFLWLRQLREHFPVPKAAYRSYFREKLGIVCITSSILSPLVSETAVLSFCMCIVFTDFLVN